MQFEGTYDGAGRNHEGEDFVCNVTIAVVAEGNGIALTFRARSADGATVFHSEHGLLSMAPDESYAYYPISNNIPFCCQHAAAVDEAGLHLQYGELEDVDSFRELIDILPVGDNEIRYSYSWGMPGEEFGERSSALLTRAR